MNIFKKLVLISSLLAATSATASENVYGLPGFIGDGVILHCFCWKLQDIEAELPNIAKAGFTAVQTSPMERNVRNGDVWYDVYRPYDYKFIDNVMGSAADMSHLCAEAEKYGIKIIVDIVANHGTGQNEAHDAWWDINNRMIWGTGGIDYSSRYSETHNELGNYGESNSDDPEVQERTLQYIRELKGLGVKGLRWDAAKHITLPSEGCEFWNVTLSEPDIWSYGEILGTPAGQNGTTLLGEYASLMNVTNSTFAGTDEHDRFFEHGIMPERQVYWAESHDTYCNEGQTVNLTEKEIDQRWALVASRKGATALYLSRPLEKQNNRIKVAVKGSTHFTAKEVAAVNHFHNAMGTLPEAYAETDGAKAVYRTRGVVIVKDGGGEVSLPVKNLDRTVAYKDEVTGSIFTISGNKISGTIDPETGIAVVYDYDNILPTAPEVTVTNTGGTFSNENYFLILTAHHALNAEYTIEGQKAVSFNGEVKIPLGKLITKGQTVKISWTAYGQTQNVSGSGTYSFVEETPEEVKVYLHFDDTDWGNNFYTFIYDSAGNNNAGWPGQKMTYDNSLTINGISGGWFYYDVPEKFINTGVAMVSDNGSHRYPADQQPGIPINGHSLVFMHHGGDWTTGMVDAASISDVDVDTNVKTVAYYSLTGMFVQHPVAGEIYIAVLSDGTAKKIRM